MWLGFAKSPGPLTDTAATIARGGPEAVAAFLRVLGEQKDSALSHRPSAWDAELTVIRNHLDRHEIEVAEAKLDDLERRAVASLEPHQWYELKALRFRVHMTRWQWDKAGRLLLDAKRHMPATERAKVNEALGYELLGDRAHAHELATALRSEFPQSAKTAVIWVRTAPDSMPFESLVAATESLAPDNEEINLALAHRAFVGGHGEKAIQFATKATELCPDSPQAWLVLGESRHAAGFGPGRGGSAPLLRDAVAAYTRAIELAQTCRLTGLEAVARFNRGKVRDLLDDPSAESDMQRAVELAGPDQQLRIGYAGYLLQKNRVDRALQELGGLSGVAAGDRLFFEAAARYERNSGNDREVARLSLKQLIDASESERWVDAHILAAEWAVDGRTESAAQQLLATSALREKAPATYHTLHGWLLASAGETEAARASLRRAIDTLPPGARRDELFLLAQVLVRVDEDALALPLLERAYRPGVFDDVCKKLLAVAKHIERHDVSVRVCRELREAGVTDPRVIETEINVLQRYDPNEALRVAAEYLRNCPEDRHVALWQSALALRLDQADLVISDPARLPPVSELTAEGSGLVVSILEETGQPMTALGYAYETLRTHFGVDFAHGHYIATFLRLHGRCPELRVEGRAGPGTAVRYRADPDAHWAVIEDGPDPDMARDEFAPNHPLSAVLTGHQAGDTVALTESGVQPRVVTVEAVLHKLAYRYHDCRDRYQIRFPGGTAIQMVHVGSGDEFDPSPIVRSLEERRRYVHRLDEMYRTNPMPFPTFVELAGANEFEAWGHLVGDSSLGIRCGSGENGESGSAIAEAEKAKELVLDLCALVTVANLGMIGQVASGTRRCVVAQTVFERLQHLAEAAADQTDSKGVMLLASDGTLAAVENSPEDLKRRAKHLAILRDTVRDKFDIRPCPKAAAMDPSRRKQIVDAVGRPSLDSFLLAAEPGAVLWTDDHVLGVLGRTDFQTVRVWTQSVLFVLRREEQLTQQEFDHTVAKMVGWHYRGMIINDETLVAAAEVADWHMNQWPVPQVMETLANAAADPRLRVAIAAQAIRRVWHRNMLELTQQGFLYAVLTGMRHDQLIGRLYRLMPAVFTVDALSAQQVRNYIAMWLNRPHRIIVP